MLKHEERMEKSGVHHLLSADKMALAMNLAFLVILAINFIMYIGLEHTSGRINNSRAFQPSLLRKMPWIGDVSEVYRGVSPAIQVLGTVHLVLSMVLLLQVLVVKVYRHYLTHGNEVSAFFQKEHVYW